MFTKRSLITVDYVSALIFLNHQVSLRCGDALASRSKIEFEASQHGIQLLKFHGDDRIFASEVWLNCCKNKQ